MRFDVRIWFCVVVVGLLVLVGMDWYHHGITGDSGGETAKQTAFDGFHHRGLDRASKSRNRSDQRFKRGDQIDVMIEKSIASNPNLPLLNGRGITVQGSAALGLDDTEVAAINSVFKKTRDGWLAELAAHLKEVTENKKESVEYQLDANMTGISELRNTFKSEIEEIAGVRLADLSLKAFEVDPEFLGFGKYDLYFRIDYNSELRNPQGEKGGWTIYHEERLLGSGKVATSHTWRAADFSRIFGVFRLE